MIIEFLGKKRKPEIGILMKENQTAILHFCNASFLAKNRGYKKAALGLGHSAMHVDEQGKINKLS